MKLRRRLWLGLTRNVAFTTPGSDDPRLQGRTYAIPFQLVWKGTLELIESGLMHWSLVGQDDREGIIRARVEGHVTSLHSVVTIRIGLDPDAQTRVDALAACRAGRMDLGVNARRLGRYFKALDGWLEEHRQPRAASRAVGA